MGLLDNTLVVLTADHGESLGERGPESTWLDGTHWLHGDDVNLTGTQVPLIIYDPRSPRRNTETLTAPIQHIDIMPTIMDLLGLPIPRQAQGKSIVGLMRGTDDGADRVAVSILGDDSQVAITSADGWRMLVNRATGERELYNVAVDREERTNLAAQSPAVVAALTRRLDSWAQANRVAVASRPTDSDSTGGL
jgi:arylsulfatase A-like enzyme